ncbi:MAG: rRNA maturation RNase YbeY [Synergistaceae bacterium]|nr:rRNA maturation RNase YbeY [Synergistaceae bacterium]
MRVILNVDDSDEGDSPAGQDFLVNNKAKLEQVLAQEILDLNKELQGYDEIYISLSIVGLDEIKNINKNYRQCDEATDVLSFPMFELFNGKLKIDAPQGLPLMLGDIIICPQKTFEMHLELENHEALLLMLAHSLLHLLGWDHDTEERQRLMWQRQDEIKDNLLKALSN